MRVRHLSAALALACIASAPLALAATPPATSAPASSTPQWSGHHGEGMHHRDGQMGRHMGMLDQLDLSTTQQASIKQLRQQSFQQARASMQTLHQQRMAFENATPGSNNYQTAADALATAEANATHARVLNEADLRSKIYNVLTPAQRTKLASLRTAREARMQQWHETHMQHKAAASSATPAAASN